MARRRVIVTKHALEQGRRRADLSEGDILREFRAALGARRVAKSKPRFVLGPNQTRHKRPIRPKPGSFRYAWPANERYCFTFRRHRDHDTIVTVLYVRNREEAA